MSLYDNIKCEVPLPNGWIAGELQTKDFNCEMVTHTITKEGRLLLDNGYWKDVPKDERGYPDASDDDIKSLYGCICHVPKMEDTNFHGIVKFGGLEVIRYEPHEKYGPKGRPIYKSHDYLAKFTDGKLVEITLKRED